MLLGVLEELGERIIAVVVLVESGVLAFDALLDHRAPDHVLVLADQSVYHLEKAREGLGLLLGHVGELARPLLGRLGLAHDILVEEELVAVVDQQVARRILDAEPHDVLVVFLQLRHQRRKVAVAADDREDADVVLGVAEIHGVNYHADVGAVLAADRLARNLDQLYRDLVEDAAIVGVVLPIRVGLLDDELAPLEEATEDLLDREVLVPPLANTERDVLEIHEESDFLIVSGFKAFLFHQIYFLIVSNHLW